MPIYFRKTPVSEPFAFDSVGNHWPQERVIRTRGFNLHHFLMTESGRGHIEIQGQKYTLSEGEGVLIAPFISHSYVGESSRWTTAFATITGTMESSIAHMLGNRQMIFTGAGQGPEISSIITGAICKMTQPHVDARALSIDCYQLLMHFIDGIYTDKLAQDPLYLRYIEPVIKEIEMHYASRLTVRDLSQKVYITPQYLSRLFSRFLGCSTYEYLTTYRINKAKELLLTYTHMDIQHIAHQSGFEDASHFIAMFRKITGVTPLTFRYLHQMR